MIELRPKTRTTGKPCDTPKTLTQDKNYVLATPSAPLTQPTFAFVIHPLTTRFIYHDKRFTFARYLPQGLVERLAAHAPPLVLSRMRGVQSAATGVEVQGLLLTLGATSREIVRRQPLFTYRRLLHAARIAEQRGARIMGLGAFTSVVGDAGVTVAQESRIGITSGNALTVATTLATARRALELMGTARTSTCAMVIGATGSIGAACARLLAQEMERVVLVAPRIDRLLALKQQIARETPWACIDIATRADDDLVDADLVITATSALTGNVLDIARLKPGAVVCVVAQPADVCAEDAARRPDVLVVESGEVVLPGRPRLGFDMGLPPGHAYACLAETMLLAMEGRFADYTLGREIAPERVREIHQLMQKHGMELSDLHTFGRAITPAELAHKRRLAAARRAGACATSKWAHR